MGFNNGKEVTERKKERQRLQEDVENSSLSLHCHILYIRIQFIQHICLIKYKNQVLLLVQTIRNGFIFQCQTEIFEKNKQIRWELTSQSILDWITKWKVTLQIILTPGIYISQSCLRKVMRSYEEPSRCFASQTNFHQWWASCVFIKNVIKTSSDYVECRTHHQPREQPPRWSGHCWESRCSYRSHRQSPWSLSEYSWSPACHN